MTNENNKAQEIDDFSIRQNSETKPPFGISLLSIAIVLFNIWRLISLLSNRDKLITGNGLPIATTPVSSNYFFFLCFVCVIGVGIGAAFWFGKSWGWRLFALWCFYDIFVSVKSFALLLIKNGFSFYMVGSISLVVMEICVIAFIILHLFENSTFGYYNLDASRKRYYAAYLVIGAVIGVVAQSLLQA